MGLERPDGHRRFPLLPWAHDLYQWRVCRLAGGQVAGAATALESTDIRTELDRAFAQDDEDRASGTSFKALGWDCDRREWEKVRALWAGEQPPAQPCEPTPAELASRMKWLAAEMDTVGSAMLRQAKSTGDAELRSAGWDLHDAAGALLAEIKDKT